MCSTCKQTYPYQTTPLYQTAPMNNWSSTYQTPAATVKQLREQLQPGQTTPSSAPHWQQQQQQQQQLYNTAPVSSMQPAREAPGMTTNKKEPKEWWQRDSGLWTEVRSKQEFEQEVSARRATTA